MLTKEKFKKEYIEENKAVYFETKELATQFLTIAKNFGYKWRVGKIDTNFAPCSNGEYCYKYDNEANGFAYADRAFYKENGDTIIEFNLEKEKNVLTAQEIKSVIEKAEKQKQELQQLIDSLNTVEMEQEGRAEHGEDYWYTDNAGLISTEIESGSSLDEHRYNNGNYYLSSREMRKTEKKALLLRLLDRFSRQNGWNDDIWKDVRANKWYIYFNYNTNNLHSDVTTRYRDTCKVYFKTFEAAEDAIEKYHDLIIEVMI